MPTEYLQAGGFTRGSSFVKAFSSTNSPFLPIPHLRKQTLDFLFFFFFKPLTLKEEQNPVSPDLDTRELNRKMAIWTDHGN